MVLLMLCMGLTSCDDILGQFDNPFGPLSISVNSIDLDADEMTLTVGDVGQLIATVGPENATDKTVTWTSSNESVATVDATGKVTAIAEGTAKIKAKAGSISTTCIVTVKAATVAVTSVTLDKTELALTVGDAAVQLTATVMPDNATNADVDWTSSDVSVATVDGSGLVTAVADGTATITAKAGDKTAECKVTVSKKAAEVIMFSFKVTNLAGDDQTNAVTSLKMSKADGALVAEAEVSGGKITIKAEKLSEITAAADFWFEAEIGGKPYVAKVNIDPTTLSPETPMTLAMATIGDVILSDGKFAARTSTTGTNAAMIAYLGSETGVEGYTHGLAIALDDDGKMNWSPATGASGAAAHIPNAPTTTTSSWMLPSKDQWINMITAAGGYTALRDGFSGIAGASNLQSGRYWSSTKYNDYNAWFYGFDNDSWNYGSMSFTSAQVRACLAF